MFPQRYPNGISYFLALFVVLWSGFPSESLSAEMETYTHKLSQSTQAYQIWTTPPSERVFRNDPVPAQSDNEIRVYAAKNEFEPFQIVVKPTASGSRTISVGNFGGGITAELYRVEYVNIAQATDNLGRTGDYPDPLLPIENNTPVSLTANQNTAFWISLGVPAGTPAGDYSANVTIADVSVPVRLHLFNFAIPDEINVKSQMNFSHQAFLDKYSVSGTDDDYWMYVDKIKQFFIDRRLTPKSVLWPGGVTTSGADPYIDYNCNGVLTDNDGIWGFEELAERYLDGNGLLNGRFSEHFNGGTPFPSFMAATFKNNDPSSEQRPSSFCGVSRNGTWNTASASYNQKWFQYMGGLQNYLNARGYLDQAYYYFANEPQNQADYDAIAWYSQELKKAAPHLKLMVSEPPRPEIYDHSVHTGAKIDIWLPVLNQYDPAVSHERARNHGEETWIYFLHGTRPPYFNPITLDHPGIESKLTGWLLWKYRIRGIAYYSLNDWSKNPWTSPMTSGHNGDTFMLYPPSKTNAAIPYGSNNHRFVTSIRLELMRDSLEDYEYLYALAGGQPEVDVANAADEHADRIISSLTSYERDAEIMYNLRRFIGMKNGGEISEIPDLNTGPTEPPGNYYINFQDPSGQPSASPLVVNGKEYMKIGWKPYDDGLGYGWYGNMAQAKYQYISNGPNELQKSIIYDDYGREKTFEFSLPNGDYTVTVSVGWQNKSYARQKIVVEGVSFVNNEGTNPSNPYLVRAKPVTVSDGKLTMEMGIFDEYTMLNYMDIEAAACFNGDAGDMNCNCAVGLDDVVGILKFTAGISALPNGCDGMRGDWNGNGKIDMADAVGLFRHLAGL